MTENEIAKRVLDSAFAHPHQARTRTSRIGLRDNLAHELRKRGLNIERQKPIPIVYDGVRFDEAYRADLLIESKVIVELKSVEATSALHAKRVLTQLRMSGLKLGLLINFGE